jgi:aryl-alcohol dehydrogenase-like predicted oxidoreductase
LIGEAGGRDSPVAMATKVTPPPASDVASAFTRTVTDSLDTSRRALTRDVLDIVRIHNTTAEMVENGRVTDALAAARQQGIVRYFGATVYGEAAAMTVIRSDRFDVLQVAFNVLDQRMAREVLPAAAASGVGVIVRSAFLKGALTPKSQWLPASLTAVRESAARARDLLAGGDWERLPEAAMRFCLSVPNVASVLTGARTTVELDAAFAAEAAGPLEPSLMRAASELAMLDEKLVNPSHWPVP